MFPKRGALRRPVVKDTHHISRRGFDLRLHEHHRFMRRVRTSSPSPPPHTPVRNSERLFPGL